jgi:hypothetical protein
VARPDIARRRLAAQRLTGSPFAEPADVVGKQGAVQAQDYAAAKWGLGLRCRAADDAIVERAVSDGAIIRTHVLRPTWHFVLPADIRWMLALTASRVLATMAATHRTLELDDATVRQSRTALTRALRDGRHLTRDELAPILGIRRAGLVQSSRLLHLLMRAELDGIICSGARRGRQSTYALLDERVPPTPTLERDEALLELTRRFFATRGPATPHDMAWWSGLTVRDARRGIEMAGASLQHETVDDQTYWFSDGAPAKARSSSAHLLPNYDEYYIGYRNRSAILERARASNANMDALGTHVVELDGQIVGGWRRTLKKSDVVIDITPVVRLKASEREAVDEAAERYAAFLGLAADISWRKVPVSAPPRKAAWPRGVLR